MVYSPGGRLAPFTTKLNGIFTRSVRSRAEMVLTAARLSTRAEIVRKFMELSLLGRPCSFRPPESLRPSVYTKNLLRQSKKFIECLPGWLLAHAEITCFRDGKLLEYNNLCMRCAGRNRQICAEQLSSNSFLSAHSGNPLNVKKRALCTLAIAQEGGNPVPSNRNPKHQNIDAFCRRPRRKANRQPPKSQARSRIESTSTKLYTRPLKHALFARPATGVRSEFSDAWRRRTISLAARFPQPPASQTINRKVGTGLYRAFGRVDREAIFLSSMKAAAGVYVFQNGYQ